MKYYRYGKFRLSDYWGSWLGIAALLIFSIASIIWNIPVFFVFFSIMYAVVWLWKILAPQFEQFSLCNDSITIWLGKKKKTILLPSELTLIVSHADICPPLSIRTAVGNETHILKNKYAISILQKMPLDIALEALHRNHMRKYTTSVIQGDFDDYRYIYSFVGNQELLQQLVTNRRCQIIIPETLLHQLSIDSSEANVFIDTGY